MLQTKRPGTYWILLVDGAAGSLAPLVGRIEGLGFQPRCVANLSDAASLLRARHGAGATLVDVAQLLADPAKAVDALRGAVAGEPLRLVVVGSRPAKEQCDRLRACGLRLALWEPFDDGAIRFQLNRAFRDDPGELRGELRVPTPLLAKVKRADREVRAIVYNLSASGAFLETPHVAPRGGRIGLEIPLPETPVALAGTVSFANVPGNLTRPHLPVGMGVRFDLSSEETRNAIRAYVETRARAFEV